MQKGTRIKRNPYMGVILDTMGVILGSLSRQKHVFCSAIEFYKFSSIFRLLFELLWELIFGTFLSFRCFFCALFLMVV